MQANVLSEELSSFSFFRVEYITLRKSVRKISYTNYGERFLEHPVPLSGVRKSAVRKRRWNRIRPLGSMNIAGDEHSGKQTSAKADQVRRRSPDSHPNNSKTLMDTFFVQRHISGKISVDMRSFFPVI